MLDTLLYHVLHVSAEESLSHFLLVWDSGESLSFPVVNLESSLQDSGPVSVFFEFDIVDELSPSEDLASNYLLGSQKEYLILVPFNALGKIDDLLDLKHRGLNFSDIKTLLQLRMLSDFDHTLELSPKHVPWLDLLQEFEVARVKFGRVEDFNLALVDQNEEN